VLNVVGSDGLRDVPGWAGSVDGLCSLGCPAMALVLLVRGLEAGMAGSGEAVAVAEVAEAVVVAEAVMVEEVAEVAEAVVDAEAVVVAEVVAAGVAAAVEVLVVLVSSKVVAHGDRGHPIPARGSRERPSAASVWAEQADQSFAVLERAVGPVVGCTCSACLSIDYQETW